MITMAVIVVIVIIGFVAGIIARLILPGPNNPKGFLLTTALGIAGSLLATLVGHVVGLYSDPFQGAGLVGAIIGAVVILLIWHRLVTKSIVRDRGL
jgi:uncharacterized membrane protein YeaQ/YmgE (transglycosylase-associated protein family)